MSNLLTRLFGKKSEFVPCRDVAALVAPLSAPALHVVKTDAVSASHFGGAPNLAPGIVWPERGGRRLDFLARISLAEAARVHRIDWLPPSGALLFFYDMANQPWGFDPKDRGASAVLLVPDLPTNMVPAGPAPRDTSPLSYRHLEFRRVDVPPSPESHAIAGLNLSDEEFDLLCDLPGETFGDQPAHQLAGFAAPVQGDGMALECHLASNGIYCGDSEGYKSAAARALEPGADNWRLLFQIDSDDDLGVMWGDCGRIYFWVEEEAARAGDFSNAWLILQCS